MNAAVQSAPSTQELLAAFPFDPTEQARITGDSLLTIKEKRRAIEQLPPGAAADELFLLLRSILRIPARRAAEMRGMDQREVQRLANLGVFGMGADEPRYWMNRIEVQPDLAALFAARQKQIKRFSSLWLRAELDWAA